MERINENNKRTLSYLAAVRGDAPPFSADT